MKTQIRIYRIRPGELSEFADEWRRLVLPLRQRFGFDVLGAWQSPEANAFVWMIRHSGDFESADREYYASPERASLDPDPARHIVDPLTFFVTPVAVEG